MKGSHILVGSDGMVCLSGLRKSIMLPQKRDKPQVAHHFPSHAVAVLPWMAPEILQQVRVHRARESKPSFKTIKTRDVAEIHESVVLP